MSNENHLDDIGPSDITLGNWPIESESEAVLDSILAEYAHLWTVRSQVEGELIQPSFMQERKGLRVDRILIPKPELLKLGWKHGAVGFECKRSGEKIGPPIAQAADYSRSLFKLDNGVKIWLDMVFVWSMAPQHGPLASVLYQQRVGAAFGYRWAKLKLKLGEVNILCIDSEGKVSTGNGTAIRKAGSR